MKLLGTIPSVVSQLVRKYSGLPTLPELYYVVPDASWATDSVGFYITSGISEQFGWRTHITSTPHLLTDHIIHYGEVGAFLRSVGSRRNARNTIIATIFHGNRLEEFPHLTKNTECFLENMEIPSRIVTTCRIMADRLIAWGIPPEKVVRIPLGVDLENFRPISSNQRLACRRRMGIPNDAICIGSFQKDGVGWGEGLTPKLIKGPDIFLKVIERLHRNYNLYVVLTAPARGYVKRGLDALGVPYRHDVLSDYRDIATLYHCLDLYLITSREEGGPHAVLESLASGVPLVSTRVGLAPDVLQHGHNGLLADPEDVDMLAECAARLIEQDELRRHLITNGLTGVVQYGWPRIAAKYYHELYLPLLTRT